ncbi:hypothetical protein FYJ51_04895 [Erysipelotrichaceae bacterium Oil+RF-744-GAM-WT-6]|uniref:Uncharacterized protein n=2 Tax=Erysipelotrichaceae TaxID=128827 RepID=A0A7X2NRL9_9FIRM|nr:hypothetical protein [Stecheria intestinalis]MDD7678930.1 hypothetical protein [Stecheria intestinalis]MSS58239.1 hypothetical protein [Stecheria intestinalis]
MTEAENKDLVDKTSGKKQKMLSMAMKVDEATASEFRKIARESGMEQGTLLNAMIENFRLNENKTLYKEHAEDIQTVQDLMSTILYKYVALLAENKVSEEKAKAKQAQEIAALKQQIEELSASSKLFESEHALRMELESRVAEQRNKLDSLQNQIQQMAAQHTNEMDALRNKYNAELVEQSRKYAEEYQRFLNANTVRQQG